MRAERFYWLVAVIAAHRNQTVVGRTRLQKTIKLLQSLGLPTDYDYMNYFYGPYSEGLQADIHLLEHMGLVEEDFDQSQGGLVYYKIKANIEAPEIADLKDFKKAIDLMDNAEAMVLELAATYDSFREMGFDHKEALARLKRKKPDKCTKGNLAMARGLLGELGLPVS